MLHFFCPLPSVPSNGGLERGGHFLPQFLAFHVDGQPCVCYTLVCSREVYRTTVQECAFQLKSLDGVDKTNFENY